MKLTIAISSGKGGTGKTFVATNITAILAAKGRKVRYLDCDVEAPNGHLFLKPRIDKQEDVLLRSPAGVDEEKCINCGKCAEACHYNAIAIVKNKILFFKELCKVCGACKIVCPTGAIVEKERKIGSLIHAKSGEVDFHYALLETGEGAMSVRLVRRVRDYAGEGINILDSSPGTACPVVETVRNTDLCVLVTDPTPFGVNDLKLAVEMARQVGQEPVVVVNRSGSNDDNLKKYCRTENLEIIGEIPDDRRIAEVYSVGDIVVEKLPQYKRLFEELSSKIMALAQKKRPVKRAARPSPVYPGKVQQQNSGRQSPVSIAAKPKELVIISGKGGTGKTSIAACFAVLAKDAVIADCDVDAADLHLILNPQIEERGYFSGGVKARINQDRCTACGRCREECRFSAVQERIVNNKRQFFIDPLACEGCGVCLLVCQDNAIEINDVINGEWFISRTRVGPMSHAKLGIAEENSGKLVTLVKNKEASLGRKTNRSRALIDGSPGTGCPVIASLSGADYALVVTEPTVSGVHDAGRILDLTGHFKIPSGIIVNKYDLNPKITEEIKLLSRDYQAEFIGVISYDQKVTEAQINGLSAVEYAGSSAAKSIEKLWQKIDKIIKKQ